MGPEKLNKTPDYEVKHFDDLEAADLALRGMRKAQLKDDLRSELRSISEDTNTSGRVQTADQDSQGTQADTEENDRFGEIRGTEDDSLEEIVGEEVDLTPLASDDELDSVNHDDHSEEDESHHDYEEDESYRDYDDEEEDYYDDYEDDYYDDYEQDDFGPERTEALEREQKFELFTVPEELLEEYGIPKDLPQGVCVMGGTARSLARRMVSGDREPVRDLDLVHIPELSSAGQPLSQDELDRISQKYMPDDFAYDHGAKTENIGNYFGTRDLTVNQCLLTGDQLLMTRAAYDDLQENIIRPTYYARPYENVLCEDRLLLRALLLQTVLKESTESYPTLEDFAFSDDTETVYIGDDRRDETITFPVNTFQQAVTLNKAMSRGVKTAQDFTETLAEWGMINPKFVGQPMALARDLNSRLDHSSIFRPLNSPLEDPLGDRQNNYNNLAELEPGSANYFANDPAVRQAMREYDSRPSQTTRLEPQGTTYGPEDYEWINKVKS